MLNSNNFDWSYVISGITLVVAIVSPVLVTILPETMSVNLMSQISKSSKCLIT